MYILQGVADVPIYGRIATLQLFRPPVGHDQLHLQLSVLVFCGVDSEAQGGWIVRTQRRSAGAGRGEGFAFPVDGALHVLRASVGLGERWGLPPALVWHKVAPGQQLQHSSLSTY